MHWQMETLFTVCFLMVHVNISQQFLSTNTLPPSSLSPFLSLSLSCTQYRAVFCQRRGVGTSHLLLLQRDSHGVQLPGEGIEAVLVKIYPPFPSELLVFIEMSCLPIQSVFIKRTVEEYLNVLLKCSTMKADTSIICLCHYYSDVNINNFPTATLTFLPHICLSAYLIQQTAV